MYTVFPVYCDQRLESIWALFNVVSSSNSLMCHIHLAYLSSQTFQQPGEGCHKIGQQLGLYLVCISCVAEKTEGYFYAEPFSELLLRG